MTIQLIKWMILTMTKTVIKTNTVIMPWKMMMMTMTIALLKVDQRDDDDYHDCSNEVDDDSITIMMMMMMPMTIALLKVDQRDAPQSRE